MKKSPVMLMILDGYGLSDAVAGNAVAGARKPNFDRLWKTCGHGHLEASGERVGLPDKQNGNSEVGHLNIGAGRVVYQELTRISKSIRDGDFFENRVLNEAFDDARKRGKAVHLVGLLSDGGVHSHINHIFALLELARRKHFPNVYLHCFLDGRDVCPTSALLYLDQLEAKCAELGVGKIATIMGRFYGMDRDKRWERLEIAWQALIKGEGTRVREYREAIKVSYAEGITDEFVKPLILLDEAGEPIAKIENDDTELFFNFRADRARELMWACKTEKFDGFDRGPDYPNIHYVAFTQYDAACWVPTAFPPEPIFNNLGSYISSLGLRQLRIAETEKYAHVTFFFNSQIEDPYENEDRILIPSPKVLSYDTAPEMSAAAVKEAVIEKIREDDYALIILNFANPDMVGHTGNYAAAVKAVEFVDGCLGEIAAVIEEENGVLLVTADHGNAERMIDDNGGPFTAHTNNPVPYIVMGPGGQKYSCRNDGALCDIAPTLLYLLDLEKPGEMTGFSLIEKKV